MSYASLRERTKAAAAMPEADQGPQMCMANNCPCRASLSIEGGKWLCTSHAFAPADKWPQISEGLRSHDWLIAFLCDIQRMDQANQDWRSFAEQFWDGQDDYCKPVAGEMKDGRRIRAEHAIPYFNRMKGELDYRLGLVKRPVPRIPEDIGNLFHEMAQPARKRVPA